MLTADAHLFAVRPTVQLVRAFAANDYLFGQRNFQTPNEPNGMVISVLPARRIVDASGDHHCQRQRTGSGQAVGDRRASTRWCGRARAIAATLKAPVLSRCRRPRDRRGRRRHAGAVGALGGDTVRVNVAGTTLTQKAVITKMQGWSIGAAPQVIKRCRALQKTDQR